MKCSDLHLAIGAEPQTTSAELEAHLRECAACARYRSEMIELDRQIQRALKIDLGALKSDVPARPVVRLVANDSASILASSWAARVGRQWALAASVLLAVAVVLILWGALPGNTLAADVVAHVISEPLPAAVEPVSRAKLDTVLQTSNLHMGPIDHDVLFAQTCFFRGRLVPHFVVRSGNAQVTVLLLPDERVKASERFTEGGFSGVLVPNQGRGSIAVLSRSKVDSEREAREILNALQSQPAA